MSDRLLHQKLDLIAAALDAYTIEDVATVMRRQTEQDGQTVDIIDYYPPWNSAGTYGVMKIAHEYMDTDWQRRRFERYAGLRIEDLPVYDSGTALRRKSPAQPHRCEVVLSKSFALMLLPRKTDDGNNKKTLIINFLPATRSIPTAVMPKIQPDSPDLSGSDETVPKPAKNAAGGNLDGNGGQKTAVRNRGKATAPAAGGDFTAEQLHWQDALTCKDSLFFYTAARNAIPYFRDRDLPGIEAAGAVICGEWRGEPLLVKARLEALAHYGSMAQAVSPAQLPGLRDGFIADAKAIYQKAMDAL